MKNLSPKLIALFLFLLPFASSMVSPNSQIITGADQPELYLPYLKDKGIGMVVNPTSIIGKVLSVDYIHKLGYNIVKIFGPEHGFRGDQSAGKPVPSYIDPETGIEVISLYGAKNKPSKDDLKGIDVMIFDIQDVGARFYTYIITMHNVMEACAENGVELMILDRPNPNGYFIDGPILDMSLKSGIGMHPVPITHGMTIGEYAQMINGEGWLANKMKCKLSVIKVKNYAHDMPYDLPVKPSPNLNTNLSILLYPSVCLFEGTMINLGRGTYSPFTILGNPNLQYKYQFNFTPVNITGMCETPLFKDEVCYGIDLRNLKPEDIYKEKKINLKWLFELYGAYPYKSIFFDYHQSSQIGDFNKLAGNKLLKEQIIAGVSEDEIRKSWEPGLSQYKEMRKKYLLYP